MRVTSLVSALLVMVGAANCISFAQSNSPPCKASTELASRVATHPTAATYGELGAYFGQRSNFPCAIPALRSSLKLDASSAQTHYYLALALLATGHAAPAARELRSALKLKPDLPQVRLNLGIALSQLGQMDAAIDEFYAAVQADPKGIDAVDRLVKAL